MTRIRHCPALLRSRSESPASVDGRRGEKFPDSLLRTALWLCLLCSSAFVLCAAQPWIAPPESEKFENPVALSPTSIAQGRQLYLDRCADCHGKKCRGDGSGGSDLECRPSDLTVDAVLSQSDGALFWKLTQGRKPMPAYGRKLSEEQRWHVVNYLRSLTPKQKQPPGARKQPAK